MKCRRLLAAAIFFWAAAAAWPQTSSAPTTTGTTDRRITLDVVVTDKSGNPAAGLQQGDFTILDNKRQQTIASFSATGESSNTEDAPGRVVFVLDTVNTSFRAVGHAREQLEKFLRRNDGQLPVPMSLVIFTENETRVQGTPTRNGNVLADSVHAIDAGALRNLQGAEFGNELERVHISVRALGKLVAYEAKQPGWKLMIWMSAGWPLIYGPNDTLTEEGKLVTFQAVVKLSTDLRQGHLTLYSIDPLGMDDAAGLGTIYYQNFLDPVASAKKVQDANLGLQVIAVQSGGQVLNRNNDVASLIADCVADVKAHYTVGFDSTAAGHADEYHDLQVKVNKPGMIVRTRTGYYAQP
jgi:VWFA-related protein